MSESVQRIQIRQPSLHDLRGLLACRNTGLSPDSTDLMSGEDAARLLEAQAVKTDADPGWRMFTICRDGHDDMIGEVGGFVHEGDPLVIDIGWWLAAPFRGNGYATEAARRLLVWCFEIRHAGEVTAHCLAENMASRKIAERLGMRESGRKPVGTDGAQEVAFVLSRDGWDRRNC
ncbi:GNAT family N-acetyltransferase [Burkholderia perseverans]|uniref:GNAT family N-acetyltransferase n=1 Tax=Burkholderia perseverans TaxID=2615214 RepID=UPI001FEE3742|nr:GNAT family N-acetyltransferase [Burkholderia perseverans]